MNLRMLPLLLLMACGPDLIALEDSQATNEAALDANGNQLSAQLPQNVVLSAGSDGTMTPVRLAYVVESVTQAELDANGGLAQRLVNARLTGKRDAASGSAHPMEGLTIWCYVQSTQATLRKINSTQNAISSTTWLTVSGAVLLDFTTPTRYVCELQGVTAHKNAKLDVLGGSDTRIDTYRTRGTEVVNTSEGQRINPGTAITTLALDAYQAAPSAARVNYLAGVELTDIIGDASGTSIVECETPPYSPETDAMVRITARVTQLTSSGASCNETVTDLTYQHINWGSHHQKFNVLVSARPLAGCANRYRVRTQVYANNGYNAVCYHAARYSNAVVYEVQ